VVLKACSELAVTVLRTTRHRFSPYGVSVVALLAESHMAVHTWPEHDVATVDVFTCGEVDPLQVVPLLTSAFAARTSQVSREEKVAVQQRDGVGRYPGFDDYILRPVPGGGHFPVPRFRRGIGREYIMEPEAVAWQDFFCGPDYTPPAGRDVLLLHPCTWAKPYDFSAKVTRLRAVTDQHARVHRVILSNVGLVPYEYQANPFFCSYDYCAADRHYTEAERDQARWDLQEVTRARLGRFLRSRASDYRAVVVLAPRIAGGLWRTVAGTSRALGLPGLIAPSVETLRQVRTDRADETDVEDVLFDERCLADLGTGLGRLVRALERVDG
jgi:S-adenosylmethionine decarboxylase proenzyme